ncbi:MAG: organic hydroperoxide resistance protein [Limnobacter sp.]|uniref:organic hydroperoxide resistance protein n=1 Tax=Limnobacter sp. TaxID=2003368 RepID=UPI00391A892B
MQVVYSTQATSTGGREGKSATPDGRLSVTLSTPKELGGAGGPGTNPEQLFAAGYSACFIGALKFVAGQEKVKLPSEPEITGIVGIGANPKGVGFAITAELQIKLEGLDKEVAKALVEKAHQVCPYSNATRNNVDVTLTLV